MAFVPGTVLPLLVAATLWRASPAQKSGKSDVLLIIADQFRFDHFTPELTPNLWALGQRGVSFKRAYCSVPICPAARAGMLTGLSPWNHGLRGYGEVAPAYPHEMPRFFSQRGYATTSVGKTHFGLYPDGSPMKHGFDHIEAYEGLPNIPDDYVKWFEEQLPGQDPLKSGGISCSAPGPNLPEKVNGAMDWCWNSWLAATYEYPEQFHPTTWTAERALARMRTAREQDQPWFLSVSFHRPHSPYDPPQRFMTKAAELGLPDAHFARSGDGWDEDVRLCAAAGARDAWCGEVSPAEVNKTRAAYAALVMHVDEQVGRILAEVDLDNTVVMFTADHGDMQMDHYMWRKSVPYQGAVHVPMVLAFPRGANEDLWGREAYVLAELRDVFPTLAAAAGIAQLPLDRQVLAELDGHDLVCAVRKNESCLREFIALEHGSSGTEPWAYNWFALTDGTYKYIRFENGREQLFDIVNDRKEEYNLAREWSNQAQVNVWRQRLVHHLQQEGRGQSWVATEGLQPSWRAEAVVMPNYPPRVATSLLVEEEKKAMEEEKKASSSVADVAGAARGLRGLRPGGGHLGLGGPSAGAP